MAEFHRLRSLKKTNDNGDDGGWGSLNDHAEKLAKEQPTAEPPSLDHLTYRDYEHVYEPSDDTFLLLDAIQYEFQQGHIMTSISSSYTASSVASVTAPPPFIVLEIGCGSGVPSVFFQMQWAKQTTERQEQNRHRTLLSFATDVNLTALQVTSQTSNANTAHSSCVIPGIELIRCDLASALLPRLAGRVDVILFNPPYVPTPDDEVGGTGIEASWAGGTDGRRVIDRAICQIGQLLRRPLPIIGDSHLMNTSIEDCRLGSARGGTVYMITVDDNEPQQLAKQFLKESGLTMRPLFRRRAYNEFLTVQKLHF